MPDAFLDPFEPVVVGLGRPVGRTVAVRGVDRGGVVLGAVAERVVRSDAGDRDLCADGDCVALVADRQQADHDGCDCERAERPDEDRQTRAGLAPLRRPQTLRGGDDHRGVAVLAPVELGEAGLELGRECVHGRKALCRILLERAVDRRRDAKRHVAADVQDIRRRLLDVLHRDGDEALARERRRRRSSSS